MISALRAIFGLLGFCLLTVYPTVLQAEAGSGDGKAQPNLPLIGLIIDDLGDHMEHGTRAIELPGGVTYAILPRTSYSTHLAEMAHAAGKEIMLHQPMQAMNGKEMGPGGLSMTMSRRQIRETLEANLASVPYARGLNNHMGSLLTRHPGYMLWLMDELDDKNLYFVDSTTTRHTVARRIAWEQGLPNLRRNIFLDHVRDRRIILRQFKRLVEQARGVGLSLAIAHPYPETLEVLEQVLPKISQYGVELVPVSELLARTVKRRRELWQASLSH